jgi:hypothetical protein
MVEAQGKSPHVERDSTGNEPRETGMKSMMQSGAALMTAGMLAVACTSAPPPPPQTGVATTQATTDAGPLYMYDPVGTELKEGPNAADEHILQDVK